MPQAQGEGAFHNNPMNKGFLLALVVTLAAGPAHAALEAGGQRDDDAGRQKREQVIVGFYQMMREIVASGPDADQTPVPEIHGLADLDDAACQAYSKALIATNVSLQMHRRQFANDPQTFDFAQLGTAMGANATLMLCSTSGRLEKAEQPMSAQKTCSDELAKQEPFADKALEDIERSKTLTDRMKDIFEAVHAVVAAQSRANCAAARP